MGVTENFNNEVVELVECLTDADKISLKNAIINDFRVDNEIEKEKTVLYGVKDGDVVPILNNDNIYTGFPVADQGACGTEECDMNIDFSATKWDLALIKCKVPICVNSFNRDFLAFFNTEKKFDNSAQLDTLLIKYLALRFKATLENAKWRMAYFADKDSTNPLLKDANGFFIQADAGTTAGENRVELPQTAMSGEDVYNKLQEMYDLASANAWFNPSEC